MKRMTKQNRLLLTSLAILFSIYFLFPIYWLLISATKGNTELFSTSIFVPSFHSLGDNIKQLLEYEDGIFARWMLNSFTYSSITAVLCTLISTMAAYALTKYSFFLKKPLYALTLSALMIPQAATIVPIFIMIRSLHLINTYAGVILPLLASPFGVYFMTVYIKGVVPNEIIEAGRIDGANDYRIFFQLVLPITRPGLITLLLLTFTSTWNNFFLPLILLNDSKLFPTTVGLKILVSSLSASVATLGSIYPLILIASAVSILPIMLVFTFMKKYITSGITLGSVKM